MPVRDFLLVAAPTWQGKANRSILEIQLQAELEDAHWLPQAADLTDTRRVRDDLVVGGVAQTIRHPKLRGVEYVEALGAKLKSSPLTKRFKRPILTHREIEGL